MYEVVEQPVYIVFCYDYKKFGEKNEGFNFDTTTIIKIFLFQIYFLGVITFKHGSDKIDISRYLK